MVVLAAEQRLHLDLVHLLLEVEQLLVRFLEQFPVALLAGEFEAELGVLEARDRLFERFDLGLGQLESADDLLCLLRRVPEVGLVHLVLELLAFRQLGVVVQGLAHRVDSFTELFDHGLVRFIVHGSIQSTCGRCPSPELRQFSGQ